MPVNLYDNSFSKMKIEVRTQIANNQTGKRNDFDINRVIVTALLMLHPHWSQQLITQALNINNPFISKAKLQAIRYGLMDDKRIASAERMEFLEWAKTQYDIMANVKKVNQFSSK